MVRPSNHSFAIASFGVSLLFTTNESRMMNEFRSSLETNLGRTFKPIRARDTEQKFELVRNARRRFELKKNGEIVFTELDRRSALHRLVSEFRLTIAEYAVGRVFIHAGVVRWKGKAIVIPGRSFKGKTALTAELIRLGAVYYSDEYAVLDNAGRVHPYPKHLSLRGIKNDREQVDRHVSELGGSEGKRPIPVGLIVITEYKKNATWNPKTLNAGKGAMKLIDNAVPIRRDPKFALPVITTALSNAVIVSSKRGEASETAPLILKMLENR